MNLEIAAIDMRESWVMSVGTANQRGPSFFTKIHSAMGWAPDVRMGGGDYPDMSIAGNGNQGIKVIIPIAVVEKALGFSNRGLAEQTELAAVTLVSDL